MVDFLHIISETISFFLSKTTHAKAKTQTAAGKQL
jgi:hypothetical protein